MCVSDILFPQPLTGEHRAHCNVRKVIVFSDRLQLLDPAVGDVAGDGLVAHIILHAGPHGAATVHFHS